MDQIAVNLIPYTDDHYRTIAMKIKWRHRLWPGCSFYHQMLKIVFRSAAQAKRGQYHRQEWIEASHGILKAIESIGGIVEIAGIEHVKGLREPCVFIGNHMSTLETFVLPAIIAPYCDVTFVVKQSLVEYPIFKHIMRSRDPIVVSRKNARADLVAVFEQGAEKLGRGISIVVFPQRTRTPKFDPEEFNSIGVKLASRSQVPIIPIALKTDAWGSGKLIKDFGSIDPQKRIYFAFGPQLRISDRGVETHQKIIQFISHKLNEWNEIQEQDETRRHLRSMQK